jgi:hypothetical protein
MARPERIDLFQAEYSQARARNSLRSRLCRMFGSNFPNGTLRRRRPGKGKDRQKELEQVLASLAPIT